MPNLIYYLSLYCCWISPSFRFLPSLGSYINSSRTPEDNAHICTIIILAQIFVISDCRKNGKNQMLLSNCATMCCDFSVSLQWSRYLADCRAHLLWCTHIMLYWRDLLFNHHNFDTWYYMWTFCRNLRSLRWVLSSLRLLVICAGAWTSEIWILLLSFSWGIAMGGRLLRVEGLWYAPFMVGSQKLLWLLQALQTLQLYLIWYTFLFSSFFFLVPPILSSDTDFVVLATSWC